MTADMMDDKFIFLIFVVGIVIGFAIGMLVHAWLSGDNPKANDEKIREAEQNAYDRLVEPLASYAHTMWCEWIRYIFTNSMMKGGSLIVPARFVTKWKRQLNTDYEDLPDNEKESDRFHAREMLNTIRFFGE